MKTNREAKETINNKQPSAPIQNQILTTNLPPEGDPEALPPEEHLCHPHFYTEHKWKIEK